MNLGSTLNNFGNMLCHLYYKTKVAILSLSCWWHKFLCNYKSCPHNPLGILHSVSIAQFLCVSWSPGQTLVEIKEQHLGQRPKKVHSLNPKYPSLFRSHNYVAWSWIQMMGIVHLEYFVVVVSKRAMSKKWNWDNWG